MKLGEPALVAALLAVSALGVARSQPRLAGIVHDVKSREDVYALPPPAEFKLVDLGYDAAAVDLLWAKLLVDYGIHIAEHRDFHPDPYLDTLLYVEPTYAPVYRFADTLLCFRPPRGTEKDAIRAREILEQGTRVRPGDYEVWLEYGQFVAFLGPSFLSDQATKDKWRHDGAMALMKAVDLGADADRAISAATILSKSGERDAVVQQLQRNLVITDDPITREQIQRKLNQLGASAQAEEADRYTETLRVGWQSQYPFLTPTEFLLMGPGLYAARCAGPQATDDPVCARDWDDVLRAATKP